MPQIKSRILLLPSYFHHPILINVLADKCKVYLGAPNMTAEKNVMVFLLIPECEFSLVCCNYL